ncbi:SymE family type I addiction module toxin [Pantoea cypripedii]
MITQFNIAGKWLNEAGLETGEVVTIRIEPNYLK